METWFIFSLFALVLWGVQAFFIKIAVNSLGTKTAFVFMITGGIIFLLFFLFFVKLESINLSNSGVYYALIAGLIGTFAFLPEIYAFEKGKLSIVTPIISLYPLVTIILALLILKEKITILNGVGALLAVVAVTLLSL